MLKRNIERTADIMLKMAIKMLKNLHKAGEFDHEAWHIEYVTPDRKKLGSGSDFVIVETKIRDNGAHQYDASCILTDSILVDKKGKLYHRVNHTQGGSSVLKRWKKKEKSLSDKILLSESILFKLENRKN